MTIYGNSCSFGSGYGHQWRPRQAMGTLRLTMYFRNSPHNCAHTSHKRTFSTSIDGMPVNGGCMAIQWLLKMQVMTSHVTGVILYLVHAYVVVFKVK